MVRFLAVVLLSFLLSGCGGDSNSGSGFTSNSSGAGGPVTSPTIAPSPIPSPQPSTTASPTASPQGPTATQITLNLIREANLRAYPGATQVARIRLKDATGRIIVGPLERTPGRIVLADVPNAATVLELEYVIGQTVLGIARIPLTLTGAPLTIDDPDFTDVDRLTQLILTPANVSLAPGGSQQLEVTGAFSDGQRYDLTHAVRYAVANQTLALVTDAGLVQAVSAGETQVTARLSGVTGAANVLIRAASITNISVTPADAVVNESTRLSYFALATLSDGSRQDVSSRVEWSTSRADVARFSPASSEAQALSPGQTQIAATLQGITGTTTLTVTGTAASRLQVFPANSTIRRLSTRELTVNATYPDGSVKDVTRQATYASRAPEIAPVSEFGTVFGAFPGTTTITATLGGLSAEANVTVDDSGFPGPVPTPTPATSRSSGRFLARSLVIPSAPGFGPLAVVREDFNRDGRPDLAAVNELSDNLQVNLNQGAGLFVFGSGAIYNTPRNPVALAAGDFDRDGSPDLVTVNAGRDNVRIFLNNGSGVFTASSNVSVGNRPSGVAVADLDGNGTLDMAVSNRDPGVPDGTVTILLGDGAGAFTPAPGSPLTVTSRRPQAIVAADFVGSDGLVDLLTVNSGPDGLTLFANLGSGSFGPQNNDNLGAGSNPLSLAVGNFNGDGFPDIVVGNQGNDRMLPFLNRGTFPFDRQSRVDVLFPTAVATGDVNNDGFMDVVAASDPTPGSQGQVVVGLGDGTGAFTRSAYPTGRGTAGLTVGDVNGDGRTDVVTSDYFDSNLSVLQNIGTGALAPVKLALGGQTRAAALADFNGDGRLDSAVARDGLVDLLFGTGTGTFGLPATPVPAGAGVRDVITADLNGDGFADLATADRDANTVSILLGDGAGGFTAGSTSPVTVGARPRALASADFDGDGRLDLAVVNRGTQDVTILRNDGAGAFSVPASPPPPLVGANPRSLVAGDFNRDGLPDLISANPGDNTLTILLNTGGLSFSTATLTGAGDAVWVTRADYNGDGLQDVGLADRTGGRLTVFLGDGAGGFPTRERLNLPLGSPRYVISPDVDGDGRPDLISVCSDCSFLIVVRNLNFGAGRLGTPEYYEFVDVDGPLALAAGDLNGDQVLDLVLPSLNGFLQVVLGLRLP